MRHRSSIPLPWLLGCLLAVPALPSYADAPRPHEERARVVAVEVPVQVTVKGEPVRGLTAANFEVSVKGRKQKITGFQVVDIAQLEGAAALAKLPVSARRHFLFLFDLTFSEPGPLLRARRSVGEVLDRMHPTDLAAVATYSVNQGPNLVLGFTPDREQVRTAVATLGAPNLVEGSLDPLRLTLVEPDAMAPGLGALGGREAGAGEDDSRTAGLGLDEIVREYLAELQVEVDSANRSILRNHVARLAGDFGALARMMAEVGGRKYVVYLSQGFDSSTLFATTDREQTNRMNRAIESGEIWNVESEARFGSAGTQGFLETMLEEFRRADCVIQAVDIGAAAADTIEPGRRSGTDALSAMASGTGGELYRNYNDLGEAMDRVLTKTGVSYLLAFQPGDLEPDGKYYPLKVTLQGAPKGARAEHRAGFYAPRPFGEHGGPQRQLRAADLLLAGEEHGSLPVRVLAAPFRSADAGRTGVALVAEIDGRGLAPGDLQGSLPAEIYGYALDRSGRIRDLFAQRFTLDLAKLGATLQQRGLKFYGDFQLPPGAYSLRLLVREGLSGAAAMRMLDLEVPALAEGGAVLLPPIFPEPAGRWLMVREGDEGRSDEFPFTIEGNPYLPALRPVLRSGEDASLFLIVHNAGEAVSFGGALVAADGTAHPIEIEQTGRLATPRGAATFIVRFPVAGLGPGGYTLRVTLTDPDGGAERSASIAVEVVRGEAERGG